MKTRDWLKWFKGNAKHILKVEDDGVRLSQDEIQQISGSIQSFQLGECSEGKVLLEQAKVFAKNESRPEYVETIKYLIREENMHSAYLGQFMSQQGIPKKENRYGLGLSVYQKAGRC